jgi:signal recognition particle receptor subunit alpha
MYDLFCIFTTGGLILWYKQMLPEFKFDVVNSLIKTVLLDEKRTVDSFKQNDTIIKWKILNDLGLIFLVAYKEAYNLLYVDQLLDLATKEFSAKTLPNLKKVGEVYYECPNFSENFTSLLKKWQQYCAEKREYG